MDDVDWHSFEIKGIDVDRMEQQRKRGFKDRWIPQVVRDSYAEWISE